MENYKELLTKALEWYNSDSCTDIERARLEDMFPALMKSDEVIRTELCGILHMCLKREDVNLSEEDYSIFSTWLANLKNVIKQHEVVRINFDIVPKFAVGTKIVKKDNVFEQYTVECIHVCANPYYVCVTESGGYTVKIQVLLCEQDKWQKLLVPEKIQPEIDKMVPVEEVLSKLPEEKEAEKSTDDCSGFTVEQVLGTGEKGKIETIFKVGDVIVEKDFDECGIGTIAYIDYKNNQYVFDDGSAIWISEQYMWKKIEVDETVIVKSKLKGVDHKMFSSIVKQLKHKNNDGLLEWFVGTVSRFIELDNMNLEKNVCSDVDLSYINDICKCIQVCEKMNNNGNCVNLAHKISDIQTWIVKLQCRMKWNPTDEQMANLWSAASDKQTPPVYQELLTELFYDLELITTKDYSGLTKK